MEHRATRTVIGVFASCGQALRAVDELATHGIPDDQLSLLVCRSVSSLTAADDLGVPSGGAAAGRLAGAVLAAIFAASELCFTGVDALGAGPLMRAITAIDRYAVLGWSLAERLVLLGFDAATAERVDVGFASGDIVLGVDTDDNELSVAAARTFTRVGARAGVAVIAL